MKRIAIYSRKSKFTGKGDSIEMCKEYLKLHFADYDRFEISVYEDEGVSGKSLDRPQFKRLMSVEESEPFDCLIVYRLDRVSRNVGDFSGLIEKLNSLGTAFISIKEQFDTSTPMGRAMMNIAAVFAQLERETIAERIKDNMYQLAKLGRWTGGTTPLGYKSVEHTVSDANGKSRRYFTLEINEDEIELVKLIFTKYSELQSVHAVEQYLNKTKNLTRNGKEWSNANAKRILNNPIYCIADEDSLEYFTELGCNICFDETDCDGVSGILPYNRHTNQKSVPPEKWMITVSTHKGLLSGKEWVRIQNLLEKNSKYHRAKFEFEYQNGSFMPVGMELYDGEQTAQEEQDPYVHFISTTSEYFYSDDGSCGEYTYVVSKYGYNISFHFISDAGFYKDDMEYILRSLYLAEI